MTRYVIPTAVTYCNGVWSCLCRSDYVDPTTNSSPLQGAGDCVAIFHSDSKLEGLRTMSKPFLFAGLVRARV